MPDHEHDADFAGHSHPGFDPQHLIEMETRRRAMLPPEEILRRFLTRTDATMLDLGCGAGYLTVPAAKILTDGKVYAVDLQQNMVDTTLERSREAKLTNVEGVRAPASRLPLSDAAVDVVLMSMVFHDLDDREGALAEVARVLKPGGALCMIEMDRVDGTLGPPMGIRISPDELTEMLTAAHFSVVELTTSQRQDGIYFVRAQPS